ncbi:hypothetical protein AAG570_012020 [Ranatra chinensis]|uniref:Uncharacterized protein n=1 Tax=Ranatra chinensis TaxID=642074 RepID=A0ABD0YHZ8_9HEMI
MPTDDNDENKDKTHNRHLNRKSNLNLSKSKLLSPTKTIPKGKNGNRSPSNVQTKSHSSGLGVTFSDKGDSWVEEHSRQLKRNNVNDDFASDVLVHGKHDNVIHNQCTGDTDVQLNLAGVKSHDDSIVHQSPKVARVDTTACISSKKRKLNFSPDAPLSQGKNNEHPGYFEKPDKVVNNSPVLYCSKWPNDLHPRSAILTNTAPRDRSELDCNLPKIGKKNTCRSNNASVTFKGFSFVDMFKPHCRKWNSRSNLNLSSSKLVSPAKSVPKGNSIKRNNLRANSDDGDFRVADQSRNPVSSDVMVHSTQEDDGVYERNTCDWNTGLEIPESQPAECGFILSQSPPNLLPQSHRDSPDSPHSCRFRSEVQKETGVIRSPESKDGATNNLVKDSKERIDCFKEIGNISKDKSKMRLLSNKVNPMNTNLLATKATLENHSNHDMDDAGLPTTCVVPSSCQDNFTNSKRKSDESICSAEMFTPAVSNHESKENFEVNRFTKNGPKLVLTSVSAALLNSGFMGEYEKLVGSRSDRVRCQSPHFNTDSITDKKTNSDFKKLDMVILENSSKKRFEDKYRKYLHPHNATQLNEGLSNRLDQSRDLNKTFMIEPCSIGFEKLVAHENISEGAESRPLDLENSSDIIFTENIATIEETKEIPLDVEKSNEMIFSESAPNTENSSGLELRPFHGKKSNGIVKLKRTESRLLGLKNSTDISSENIEKTEKDKAIGVSDFEESNKEALSENISGDISSENIEKTEKDKAIGASDFEEFNKEALSENISGVVKLGRTKSRPLGLENSNDIFSENIEKTEKDKAIGVSDFEESDKEALSENISDVVKSRKAELCPFDSGNSNDIFSEDIAKKDKDKTIGASDFEESNKEALSENISDEAESRKAELCPFDSRNSNNIFSEGIAKTDKGKTIRASDFEESNKEALSENISDEAESRKAELCPFDSRNSNDIFSEDIAKKDKDKAIGASDFEGSNKEALSENISDVVESMKPGNTGEAEFCPFDLGKSDEIISSESEKSAGLESKKSKVVEVFSEDVNIIEEPRLLDTEECNETVLCANVTDVNESNELEKRGEAEAFNVEKSDDTTSSKHILNLRSKKEKNLEQEKHYITISESLSSEGELVIDETDNEDKTSEKTPRLARFTPLQTCVGSRSRLNLSGESRMVLRSEVGNTKILRQFRLRKKRKNSLPSDELNTRPDTVAAKVQESDEPNSISAAEPENTEPNKSAVLSGNTCKQDSGTECVDTVNELSENHVSILEDSSDSVILNESFLVSDDELAKINSSNPSELLSFIFSRKINCVDLSRGNGTSAHSRSADFSEFVITVKRVRASSICRPSGNRRSTVSKCTTTDENVDIAQPEESIHSGQINVADESLLPTPVDDIGPKPQLPNRGTLSSSRSKNKMKSNRLKEILTEGEESNSNRSVKKNPKRLRKVKSSLKNKVDSVLLTSPSGPARGLILEPTEEPPKTPNQEDNIPPSDSISGIPSTASFRPIGASTCEAKKSRRKRRGSEICEPAVEELYPDGRIDTSGTPTKNIANENETAAAVNHSSKSRRRMKKPKNVDDQRTTPELNADDEQIDCSNSNEDSNAELTNDKNLWDWTCLVCKSFGACSCEAQDGVDPSETTSADSSDDALSQSSDLLPVEGPPETKHSRKIDKLRKYVLKTHGMPPHIIEKLKKLNIKISWPIPPAQSRKAVTKTSIEYERAHLGRWDNVDSQTIMERWKIFCKEYGFKHEDYKAFIPNPKRYLRDEQKYKFVLFLARDFPNRPLHSVYFKFAELCSEFVKGSFTPEEDELIWTVYKKNKKKDMYALCAAILKRSRYAVYRRHKRLLKYPTQINSNFSYHKGHVLLKKLMESCDCSSEEDFLKFQNEILAKESVPKLTKACLSSKAGKLGQI